MSIRRFSNILFMPALVLVSCVEPYQPPEITENRNLLVVDANVDVAGHTASVSLSRTVPLSSEEEPPKELAATVMLEDEEGNVYPLTEEGNGAYGRSDLMLDENKRYRISIRTASHGQYFSDYVTPTKTPPIDSVNWTIDRDFLNINVNTHDDSGKSRFYRWSYTETWEYTVSYASAIRVVEGVIMLRKPEESLYRCWKTLPSTTVLVGSTTRLADDVVSNFKLIGIPKGSSRLSVKYRIHVKQQTLTEDAYTYWLNLQKTTENLGSLFDPMPSQLNGNIYSASQVDEPVIGYFYISSTSEKTITLKKSDLPKDFAVYYPPFCQVDTMEVEDVSGLYNSETIIGPYYEAGLTTPSGYLYTAPVCIDCRALVSGGVTTKPDFWD